MGLILDSSVVIAAERRGDTIERLIQRIVDATGDQEAALSAVGLTELVHGIFRAQTAEQRARREAFVEELLAALTVYPLLTPGTLQILNGVPPDTAAFCSTPPAKKPIHCPSVEKKGCAAPDVPGIAVGSRPSRAEVDCRCTPGRPRNWLNTVGGVPNGIRTRVLALKGPRPGPLDDGDVSVGPFIIPSEVGALPGAAAALLAAAP